MERKSRCSLKDIFISLITLKKKDIDIVQDPNGHNLVFFLQTKFGFKSSLPVMQRINELQKLSYIEKYCYDGHALFSVKLLKTKWQEPEQLKKKLKPKPKKEKVRVKKPIKQVEEPAENVDKKDAPNAPVVEQKRFAILIDYENLKKHVNTAKLLDFSWLFDPILSEGKIIFGYVFFPEHYATNMPIKTLSNIHRLLCVVCPKGINNNGTIKDKDTVDSKMDELGRDLAEHSDITNLVIVAGDADFYSLTEFARWRQKTVKVISAKKSFSTRFFLNEKLEKQLI